MFFRKRRIAITCLFLSTFLFSSPLLAEDKNDKDSGEYNISVRSGSTNVHQTFDKDGRPIEIEGEEFDIKQERQQLHKDRKKTRSERKKVLKKEKKAAREAKKESR